MIEEIIELGHIGINVRYSLNNKPAVLFLHFSGGNSNMWEGILPQFKEEYSIIAPDIRGHGKSQKLLTGYHINDMANDIYLLLEKLNVKHCHVVGSSMGAEVGLSLAASHPELILSLICEGALCNEFGEYGLFDGTSDEILIKKEAMVANLKEREERVFRTKEEYIEEQKEELTREGLWNEYFQAFFENSLQQNETGDYIHCYNNNVRLDYVQNYLELKFEEYYSKVQCPILFLPSEEEWKDEKIRNSVAAFSGLLETYEINHIENSIHAYVWMQLPAVVGRVAKRFIDKHDR